MSAPCDTKLRVLILGGYGTFGGRAALLIGRHEHVEVVVAGRSIGRAAAFCDASGLGDKIRPARFDRDKDIADQIAVIAPNVVIDATGPFQAYGADLYRVVKACIGLGVNYMDLADGADFVLGVSAFDKEARERGVYVLSGASSFPVLTAAVVRHLTAGWSRLDTVRAGIAPSPYAGVGLNVIRAVSGYAGQPTAIRAGGRWMTAYPLTESATYTISPPGRLPLRPTRFSLVEVPDLRLIPELWPEVRSVWVGAGPVPRVLHRGLNALAWIVRLRLLPSLGALAPVFHRVINTLRWGEHRGGMFVDVTGADGNGGPARSSWHLLAEADDGPFIPSMAVEALVRRQLRDTIPAGARPATGDLELSDYECSFAGRRIETGIRDEARDGMPAPLYARILGKAWDELPPAMKAIHDVRGEVFASGRAEVARGTNVLANLIAEIFRFPRAGTDVALTVRLNAEDGRELWHRKFGDRSFWSIQSEGPDRLLSERFGPFTFGLALVTEQGRLNLVLRRWSFLGIPLPMRMAPRGEAYESVADGRFRFDVEIALPALGRLVRYRGWLGSDAMVKPTDRHSAGAPLREAAVVRPENSTCL